jgi:hypothetical protein
MLGDGYFSKLPESYQEQEAATYENGQTSTHDHAIVSSGRPRHYYHKNCAIRLNII